MMDIGIITLYYNNANYGGLLQSYALVRAMNKIGMSARQISFDRSSDKNPLLISRIDRMKSDPLSFTEDVIKNRIRKFEYSFLWKRKQSEISHFLDKRNKAFKKFEKSIPHTKVISKNDLINLNLEFDAFICGSDQIWNPSMLREAYLLTFAADDKLKIAYAASFGRDVLKEADIQYISQKLKNFTAISVREELAGNILEKVVEKPVYWVLDPTLLLERDDWDRISEPYSVSEPYVLTYFLGDNEKQRKVIKKFARDNNLKLLGFPHILGEFCQADKGYADEELYNVSPSQFIYLIAHAKYIATDSFHACVFSIIYRKNFVAFNRQIKRTGEQMSSRIISLLKIVNLSDCLVSEDAFTGIKEVSYGNLEGLENMKKQSYDFLRDALLRREEQYVK